MKKEQNKNNDEKENKKSKKWVRGVLWTLVILLTLSIAAFVILEILLTDKNRNSGVNSNLTNQEVINSRFNDSFESLENDYVFELSTDDINVLLRNSVQTEKVSEYLDSAYVEEKDDSLNWCFDLNVPLLTTRVVMKTHNESGNYVIDSITTGKIDSYALLLYNNLLTNEMLDTLFANASLPIKSHLEARQLAVTPTDFVPLFNTGEVSSYFVSKISPYIVPLTTGIGFKASLTCVKATLPDDSLTSYDIPEKLFNKMQLGLEAGPLLQVEGLDASSYFFNGFDFSKTIETLGNDVSCKIKTARINFDNNAFNLDFYLGINEFVTKLSTKLNVAPTIDTTGFNITLTVAPNADGLEAYLLNEFITNFKTKHSSYVTTQTNDKIMTVKFSDQISVLDTSSVLFPDIFDYNFYTSIQNNKLTFTLESLY